MDFHDSSQIDVDLTKAYKNERLASNVETSVGISVSPELLKNLLPNDVNLHRNSGLMRVKCQKLLPQKL